MDMGSARQGRGDHRRQHRHRARGRQRPCRRGRRHRASPRAQADRLRRRGAARSPSAHGVETVPVACDVATAEGSPALIAAAEKAFGGADILINNAGTGSNETIMEAPDEKWQHYWELHVMAAVRLARGLVPGMKTARRRRDPPQRLDLRHAAALVRADLQRHQGRADDVFQDARQRGDQGQHPRQHDQSGPGPDARLDQDRQAADRRQGRRLGGLSRRASPTSTRRSTASPRRRSWRTSSSSCAPTAPAIRSARPISSTAAC